VTQTVTLRQLVTHRPGWASDSGQERPAREFDDGALARAVADLADAGQISPPGRFYSYNNSGFAVLGRIIEVVTRLPFEQALRRLVLDPAGLRDSTFPTTGAEPAGLALGHSGNPAQVMRPWARSRGRSPSGGLVTTAADLLRFARCLLTGGTGPDGQHVLEPGSVKAMWTVQEEAVGFAESIGLGWNIDHLADGTTCVGHGGNANGYIAVLTLVPDHRLAVAILLNSTSFPALGGMIQDWVTARFIGTAKLAEPRHTTVPKPDVSGYVGCYVNGRDRVEVADSPRGVALRSPSGQHAGPVVEAEFTAPDEARADIAGSSTLVRFLRDGGTVRWLRVSGIVFAREAGR
jgi:CubicO group peptidase (beta-lactamase class C family)